jgi:CBS-domain-containing membrane protein
MSTAAIMTKDPPTVRDDESVADATSRLVAHRYMSLPVVDGQNRYAGMFGICDLLGLLVPRVALAGDFMSNLRFIRDDPEALRRRFAEVKSRRVSEVADRNGARLHPDSPGIEAIRLCCRSHAAIPVIEKDTEKVIGIVSSWDVLRTLAGAPKPP